MEGTMSAFFGIEEQNTQGFLDKNIVCLPRSADGKPDLHSIDSPIKNEDIVFIKHCQPQSILHIKAIGVVLSDYPPESDLVPACPSNGCGKEKKLCRTMAKYSC